MSKFALLAMTNLSSDVATHVALLARAVVAVGALERLMAEMVPDVLVHVCDFQGHLERVTQGTLVIFFVASRCCVEDKNASVKVPIPGAIVSLSFL